MNNIYIYENVQYAKDYNASLGNDCILLDTNQQYDFAQITLGVEKVRKAACYVMENGEVLVGVLTEPLFSLSERLTLTQTIEKVVTEITGKQVFVTLDTDLYIQISKCKDEIQANSIKQLICTRNNARM